MHFLGSKILNIGSVIVCIHILQCILCTYLNDHNKMLRLNVRYLRLFIFMNTKKSLSFAVFQMTDNFLIFVIFTNFSLMFNYAKPQILSNNTTMIFSRPHPCTTQFSSSRSPAQHLQLVLYRTCTDYAFSMN